MGNRQVREILEHYTLQFTHPLASGSVDANAIARELSALDRAGNGLTAQAVVAAAADEASAMHACFDWNDTVAGDRWRLHQARNLLRAIKVVRTDGTQMSVYVHVGVAQAYYPMTHVVQRPDLYALAVAESHRRLELAADSLRQLQELGAARKDSAQVTPKIALAAKSVETARQIASGFPTT